MHYGLCGGNPHSAPRIQPNVLPLNLIMGGTGTEVCPKCYSFGSNRMTNFRYVSQGLNEAYLIKYLFILLSITNKMQRYTIFFITVNALQVSGGFSAHHQELKKCAHSIGCMSSLLDVTASKLDIHPMLCAHFLSS